MGLCSSQNSCLDLQLPAPRGAGELQMVLLGPAAAEGEHGNCPCCSAFGRSCCCCFSPALPEGCQGCVQGYFCLQRKILANSLCAAHSQLTGDRPGVSRMGMVPAPGTGYYPKVTPTPALFKFLLYGSAPAPCPHGQDRWHKVTPTPCPAPFELFLHCSAPDPCSCPHGQDR